MQFSWKVLVFVIILLSVSVNPLTFAQSYGIISNNTNQLKVAGIVPAMPQCQAGQIIIGHVCVSKETTCPSGFSLAPSLGYGNICIFSKPLCPSGSVSGNGVCTLITPECNIEVCYSNVSILSCPVGTDLDGVCVLTSEIQPTPPIICPEGFGVQNGFCAPSSTLPRVGCPTGLVFQNNMCVASAAQSESIPSPLKQFKSGILMQDIKCNEGFVLIIKGSNENPACVKPSTASRLLSHGWISMEKFEATHPIETQNETSIITQKQITTNQIIIQQNKTNMISNQTNTNNSDNVTSNGTNANSDTINLVTQNGTIPIHAVISSSQPNTVKLLSVGLSPYPLKVGDKPTLKATFQNISDKTFYISEGCRATSLFYTIDPVSSVQEYQGANLMCADWMKEVQPNDTFGWIAYSKSLNGYYQIVEPNLLTITLYQYVTDQKTGLALVETIQFNVTATQ